MGIGGFNDQERVELGIRFFFVCILEEVNQMICILLGFALRLK